jgi:hypothetical protein
VDHQRVAVNAAMTKAATDRLRENEASDDAGFIFGFFGALVAGILTYAGLKRWNNKIFGQQKDDEKY